LSRAPFGEGSQLQGKERPEKGHRKPGGNQKKKKKKVQNPLVVVKKRKVQGASRLKNDQKGREKGGAETVPIEVGKNGETSKDLKVTLR